MERAANPDTASTVAEAYLGDIVGAKDMINGTASSISGIEVVDDFTLRITIDEAKPYFLAKMTYPTAFVVDKTQIEADAAQLDEEAARHRPLQGQGVEAGREHRPPGERALSARRAERQDGQLPCCRAAPN